MLSEEFLAEIQGLEQKNLALEALRKLLAGEIKAKSKQNVVDARAFSQRLEEVVAPYDASAITSLEMIQELIDLSKDLKAFIERGDELGLNNRELAFYDALSSNKNAVDVTGNDQLMVIANELAAQLKNNITVDWHLKEVHAPGHVFWLGVF